VRDEHRKETYKDLSEICVYLCHVSHGNCTNITDVDEGKIVPMLN
jgi:hypothetical protein